MFKKQYSNALKGPKEWQKINTSSGDLYKWKPTSTYVQQPPFFTGQSDNKEITHIENARPLLLLGNSVTTDHISPAGAPAGEIWSVVTLFPKSNKGLAFSICVISLLSD